MVPQIIDKMAPPFLLSAKLEEVRPITEKFDLKTGLSVVGELSEWYEEIAVDSSDALDKAKTAMPETSPEIHYWVQEMGATNAAFWGMQEDYARIGSRIATDIGDAWPGVRLREVRFLGWRGRTVRRRGYGIATTRRRRYRIPNRNKLTIVEPDLLAWGAIPWAGTLQWLGILASWRELARTPINSRVRFAGSKGYTMPQFVIAATKIPTPLMTARIGITSDKDQVISLKGRSLADYTKVRFEDKIDIPKGESDTLYTVTMLPYARFLLELQPEDKTKTVLDSIKTIPP